MQILWLDPYHGGSHAAVARGYAQHSRNTVHILALPIAGGWRWRMRGAAISFARMLREAPGLGRVDLIVTTDMLDLATFLGLARDLVGRTPVALYMHENQLTYPLPPGRQRDLAFPWINYTAALAADAVFFNSDFHRQSFLSALPQLPGRYHDYRELEQIERIANVSEVLYPGLELVPFDQDPPGLAREPGVPVILWNNRWEYDKAPDAFFEALRELERRRVDFRVIVAGEQIDPNDPGRVAIRDWLAPRTIWWGYAPDLATYRMLLRRSDIVVSSAVQEFFGIAVLEAMYAGCVPVLPHRLSYPELLPIEFHGRCLYDEATPLVERLVVTIRDLAAIREADFRSVAARFAWERQAPNYDAAFARVASQR